MEPQRPLKSHATIFRQEVAQAVEELGRPAHGQFVSGLIAGIGVGFSVLLIATMVSHGSGEPSALTMRFLMAQAYAVGFVVVIMGRADLFTEYTTIALLPVLTGDARPAALARFWAIVYLANLAGGALFAVALALLGPRLGLLEGPAFGALARGLAEHDWWVTVTAAGLAGWLMGLLSWLIVAARDTVSQILFIWIVASVIGFAHLPHAITGAVEVMTAALAGEIGLGGLARFVGWTTLGNVVGGVVFAVLVRHSVLLSEDRGGRT